MTSRRTLSLTVALCALAGALPACRGRYARHSAPSVPTYVVASGSGAGGGMSMGGERLLEGLPWHPDVMRVDLAVDGPVALTGMYLMDEDILTVDTTGRLVCLARRDLNAKWVSTLKHPVAFAPGESATHYVFVERDNGGAYWLQAFSRRSGAESDRSPIRLPFSASTGAAATPSTAYVGSLGSPRDNKTLESVNLGDGSVGWGFRTSSRIVATPMLTVAGDAVIVASEDNTVVALPANPATSGRNDPLWETTTFASNRAAPALTKDLMFLGSDDNMLRCLDVHSGSVLWMKGCDAPIRKSPWTLGGQVTTAVSSGAEGAKPTNVEAFKGYVFAKNELGLHAFDATSGEEVFKDAGAVRPIVMVGDWVVTLGESGNGQLRKGKGLPVSTTIGLGSFDFIPTNSKDGVLYVGYGNGTILAASPK